MRLISATLRNYRVHRELSVAFDRALTLIGGPNESGKSTLAEAIHRALFMKAKGTSEDHRAAHSLLHGGPPEVEVTFEVADGTYHVRKRFSGTTGMTVLTAPDGHVRRDAEAETTLSSILGVEPAAGSGMKAQWSHVWVEQGASGRDPSATTSAQRARLLQRLQDVGAAAVLQSGLDAEVAARFSEQRTQIYTAQGAPRVGSPLAIAIAQEQQAADLRARAETRVRTLHATADALRGDLDTLSEAVESQVRLKAQSEELVGRDRRLSALRQDEVRQELVVKAAEEHLRTATEHDDAATRAESDVLRLEEAIQPTIAQIAEVTSRQAAAGQGLAEAERMAQDASKAAHNARERHELMRAFLDRRLSRAALDKLQSRADEIADIRTEVSSLERQLVELPDVTKKKLAALQGAWEEVLTARATLEGMATSLQVRAADVVVRVGKAALAVGDTKVFTNGQEIRVGPRVRLYLQPGGGRSIAEATQSADAAQAELDRLLSGVGLASVDAAANTLQQRSDVETEIKRLRTKLGALGADEVDDELENVCSEALAADAEVRIRRRAARNVAEPADLAAAREAERLSKQEVKRAEAAAATAEKARDGQVDALRECDEAVAAAKAAAEAQKQALVDARAKWQNLLETHGDATSRAEARRAAEDGYKASLRELTRIRTDVASLDPDGLVADTNRLERALDANTELQTQLHISISGARNALRVDGSADPMAELAAADAEASAAVRQRERAGRQAEAIRLLDNLFTEEQRDLGRQLTGPLVERINAYMLPVFGTDTTVDLEYDGTQFAKLSLRRAAAGQQRYAFDVLSGGAREQLACAVRLATAELLAPDFGGVLPVVLDDAFAYSDSARVAGVFRMLDLAARRGLQVIVLSCNPTDYEALGARVVRLATVSSRGPTEALPFVGASGAAGGMDHEADDGGDTPASLPEDDADWGSLLEQFMTALRACGGRSGNIALRNELGWDEVVYRDVKDALVSARKVLPGQGRGGSVTLVSPT